MINLMPPDYKQSIMYARRNNFLIRWLFGIALAAVGIAVIGAGGLFYLRQDATAYKESIDEARQNLASQDEAETLKRVSEMSGNLKLAVDVLSKEVMFSQLLQQIGLVMPPGTVLRDLSIGSNLAGGIDLEVSAVSYEAASQVQVNLSNPNSKIFEKADIQQLSCSQDGADSNYPCTVSVRALFVKENNPFLLLNKEAAR